MKSRKTNKTSMFLKKIYLLIPYLKAQNQTELGFKRTKNYAIENGLLNKKRCWGGVGEEWCVCVWEDLMNRF